MAVESHLAELEKKHGEIERQLDEAQLHPSIDDIEITRLKRRKLALKDEIEQIRIAATRH